MIRVTFNFIDDDSIRITPFAYRFSTCHFYRKKIKQPLNLNEDLLTLELEF